MMILSKLLISSALSKKCWSKKYFLELNVATDFYGWSFLQFRGNNNIAIIHTAVILER